jgi:hypothetical protein
MDRLQRAPAGCIPRMPPGRIPPFLCGRAARLDRRSDVFHLRHRPGSAGGPHVGNWAHCAGRRSTARTAPAAAAAVFPNDRSGVSDRPVDGGSRTQRLRAQALVRVSRAQSDVAASNRQIVRARELINESAPLIDRPAPRGPRMGTPRMDSRTATGGVAGTTWTERPGCRECLGGGRPKASPQRPAPTGGTRTTAGHGGCTAGALVTPSGYAVNIDPTAGAPDRPQRGG